LFHQEKPTRFKLKAQLAPIYFFFKLIQLSGTIEIKITSAITEQISKLSLNGLSYEFIQVLQVKKMNFDGLSISDFA